MKGILLFVCVILGWFILNRYVLPRFGIET
jgi:hypothetical protein